MRESHFVERHEADWQLLEAYLSYHQASKRRRKKLLSPPIADKDFPQYYRRLCNQLALAQTRDFSEHTTERLNRLVTDSYHFLYRRRGFYLSKLYEFIFIDFPCAVRKERRLMLLALMSFLLPAVLVFLIVCLFPTAAYSFLQADTLQKMEAMYHPVLSEYSKASRNSESDIAMFGIYVFNNVGIALRSFASGFILGIGALATAIFNGAYLGVIVAHIENNGFATQALFPFMVGHSAFELTAIVISCGAGLKLGLSFLLPGRYRRFESMARTARQLVPIIIGFTMMLVIAALIEAFWSAANVSNTAKFIVGSGCWLTVVGYFLLAGRSVET